MTEQLKVARAHMQAALDILDSIEAPADIGAQLDTALYRLERELQEEAVRSEEMYPTP